MLEQLAYLYLGNNKVSHTPASQMFVLSSNLSTACVSKEMLSFHVHLSIQFLKCYFIVFCITLIHVHSASWQREVAVSSHTLCASLCL